MQITLLNQQNSHSLQLQKLQELAEWLAEKLQTEKSRAWSEICIVFTGDEGIAKINHKYLKKNRSTDVISFNYNPAPGERELQSGDIMVNVDRAMQAGPEYNGIDYELALYLAHGFDHLSGAEDDTLEKKKAMLEAETAWLLAAETAGLLQGLFQKDGLFLSATGRKLRR